MGVRPPSNGVDDEPDVVEFGIAALDARIEERDVTFPVTRSELEAQCGDLHVAVDAAGHEIALGDALDRCDRDRFDSRQDLLDALHPVFETRRQRLSGSLMGRIRAFLPF